MILYFCYPRFSYLSYCIIQCMQTYQKHKRKYLQPDAINQQFARIIRHQQLIQNVKNYKPTLEQVQKLHKMKKRTELQIELRYKNSSRNHGYCFPLLNQIDQEDDAGLSEIFKAGLYNLHSQQKNWQQRIDKQQIYEPNRRIKSLDEVIGKHKSDYSIKKLRKIQKIQTQLRQADIQFPKKMQKSKTIVTMKNEPKKIILPVVNHKIYHLMTQENSEVHLRNSKKVRTMKLLSTESSPTKGIRIPTMKQHDFYLQNY